MATISLHVQGTHSRTHLNEDVLAMSHVHACVRACVCVRETERQTDRRYATATRNRLGGGGDAGGGGGGGEQGRHSL